MVAGNVVVPPGSWCDLVDTSIAGNLLVQGTGVRVTGSTISGNLVASGVRAADDPLSSGTNVVCNTTVGGSLLIGGSPAATAWNLGLCGENTVKGKVSVTGNLTSRSSP